MVSDSTMSLFRRSIQELNFFKRVRDAEEQENDAAARGAAKASICCKMPESFRHFDRSNGGWSVAEKAVLLVMTNTGGGGSFGTSSNNNDSFSDYS